MNLQLKFIIVFLSISFSCIVISYVSIVTSEDSLKSSIGQNSVSLASKIMNDIDQDIYDKLILFETLSNADLSQNMLLESNSEFAKIPNLDQYMDKQEKIWASGGDKAPSLVIQTLDNPLSSELKTTSEYLKDTTYYSIVSQMTITNAYGANVATTGWTANYRHDKEDWWNEAKNNYLYIGDKDLTAQRYAIDFAIRIDDSNGNFIGVKKVVMNLDELINIVKDAQRNSQYPSSEIMLLTHDGRTIYSTSNFKIYDDVSNTKWFQSMTQDTGYLEDQENNTSKLIAYSKSTGYSDYRGLGWILVIKYDTNEVLAPVSKVTSFIQYVTIMIVVISAITSLLVSKHMTKRITVLRNAANKIASGDFTIKVDASGNDEIHDLAEDINLMSSTLSENTQALLSNERLSAIGELSARIAHDLRNPLNVIKNGIEIILIRNPDMDERTRDVFTRIKRSIGRMSHQIDEVLDYIRVNPLNLSETTLSKILSVTVESMEIPKTVKINTPSKDVTLYCDFEKMVIVFTNLITNAIQAMQNNGQMDIRVYEKDDLVTIEVTDSGSGIPEENMAKIFDPLFTTKQVGTGLGLVSCRNILVRHGGSISVRNNPTTFTITLPKNHISIITEEQMSSVAKNV